MNKTIAVRRLKRSRRTRRRIARSGAQTRPRLCVFRSLKHIYAQIIDDKLGKTLAAASSLEKAKTEKKAKTETAADVGLLVAERAKKAGVEKVVFDRSSCLYHGRVKALAEAARSGGLAF